MSPKATARYAEVGDMALSEVGYPGFVYLATATTPAVKPGPPADLITKAAALASLATDNRHVVCIGCRFIREWECPGVDPLDALRGRSCGTWAT